VNALRQAVRRLPHNCVDQQSVVKKRDRGFGPIRKKMFEGQAGVLPGCANSKQQRHGAEYFPEEGEKARPVRAFHTLIKKWRTGAKRDGETLPRANGNVGGSILTRTSRMHYKQQEKGFTVLNG